MNKKKILIFLQDGVGGAERVSVLFGKKLDKQQYDVKFCLVDRNSKTSIADFIPEGYPIIRIPKAGPLKMIWQLFSIVRREHPHVVFSSLMYLNTKILIWSFLFPDIRFIIRCEMYPSLFNTKQKRRMAFTYKKADAIIAQTQEMADELTQDLHINKDKVTVIQNPVDTELIDRLVEEGCNPYPQDGRKHIVASGRFSYQKGYDLLFKSFAVICDKRHDIDLYIIGDTNHGGGQYYEEMMTLAKGLKIGDRVHCVGYQSNPYVYVRYADCFVLSSRFEGLPNVMIEAQYLGTPVAAFKCIPVIERLLTNGSDGYLAEKEDTTSLADAIQKALLLERQQNVYKSTAIVDFEKIITGGAQITTKRQLEYWCRMDFESYRMKHPFLARFTYGEHWEMFSYVRTLRHLEYYINKRKKYPWDYVLKAHYWLKHRRNCKRMLITVLPNTCGPGLHFMHRGFRRIGGMKSMRIGRNCTVLPNVLFGNKLPTSPRDGYVIGDDCYISTGVTILGPITIGNNVTIAAGAVVTNDVPDNCVVAGVPAKVVKIKE